MKETKPIHFEQENCILKGNSPDVNDLPVYRGGGNVISCWKFPFLKRLRILLTGKVWLVVRGETHPPLWIDDKAFGA